MMKIDNKIVEWHKQTFPKATLESQLLKLDEEIGELCDAIRNGAKDHASKEMADVYIVSRVLSDRFNSLIGEYFIGLLHEYPVPNLEKEVEAKFETNKKRLWKFENGVYRHIDNNQI